MMKNLSTMQLASNLAAKLQNFSSEQKSAFRKEVSEADKMARNTNALSNFAERVANRSIPKCPYEKGLEELGKIDPEVMGARDLMLVKLWKSTAEKAMEKLGESEFSLLHFRIAKYLEKESAEYKKIAALKGYNAYSNEDIERMKLQVKLYWDSKKKIVSTLGKMGERLSELGAYDKAAISQDVEVAEDA